MGLENQYLIVQKLVYYFIKNFLTLEIKFFSYLGRFDKKKGCEILIKSINKIRNNFKYKVLLAGPGYGENHQILLENLLENINCRIRLYFQNLCIMRKNGGLYQSVIACCYLLMGKILVFLL